MFNMFKTDPIKKLKKDFENKLTEAVEAQRNGKIELYAKLTTESEEILKELELLEKDIKR
jgi:molybdenum-dependent DNA-binding transcriptional regulator ModE